MGKALKKLDALWLNFAPMVAVLLLADQLTKLWALQTEPSSTAKVGLDLAYNYGILFGIPMPTWLIFVFAAVLVFGGAYLVLENKLWQDRFHLVGLALIFSGALGNIIDRLAHGFVVDFIKIHWWPTFNLADVFIVLGVGLFLWIFTVRNPELLY